MTEQQLILDSVRLLVATVGAVTAAYQVALIRLARAPGQRWRLAGIAGALAILSAGRVTHFGQAMTWELVAAFVVIGVLAYGSWKFRDEIPAQPRGRASPGRHAGQG